MRKFVAFVCLIALLLSLVACGDHDLEATVPETTEAHTEETTAPVFDLAAYKESVRSYSDKMYESSVIFYNLASYENNYWESLETLSGTVTSEKLVTAALEWIEKEGGGTKSEISSNYDNITNGYAEIVTVEVSGTEAEEIKSVFVEFFDSYLSFYTLVFSPSGTRGDFVEDVNSCIDTIENCYTKLDILTR